MTRTLNDFPTDAKTCAAFLCRVRHERKSMQPTCAICIADVLRLVAGGAPAPGSEGEFAAMAEVVARARNMPRRTPAPGGAGTVHQFDIEAGHVWMLDIALKALDALPAGPPASGEDGTRLKEELRQAEAALRCAFGMPDRVVAAATAARDSCRRVLEAALASRVPTAAPPEVGEEALFAIRDKLQRAHHDATQEWSGADEADELRLLKEIVPAVEWCAQKGGNDGR